MDSFATVYSAKWKNGPLHYDKEWKRGPYKEVALKLLNKSRDIIDKILKEVCVVWNLYISCY